MKKIILTIALIIVFVPFIKSHPVLAAVDKSGYILLQVEKNGEAWYVYPGNGERYFLGRPDDAFSIMKKLALGAAHNYIIDTDIFPARLSGLILLDVEKNGEAYYIYPKNNKKYYLGRPTDAFRIMSNLGQGISNVGLSSIPVGQINSSITVSTPLTPSNDKYVLLNVLFTSQAPFSKWIDLRQEDGCEETTSFMAVKWALGQTFTKQNALDSILGSSEYTLKKYGEYRDVSSIDTLNWIIKDYFNYKNATQKKNVTKADIISELEKGNIVIAPMNGQILHNPNYVQPGPKHHMLLIKGYDPIKDIFITNDPGTRNGNSYIYNSDVLYNAIRDYATGFMEPDNVVNKNIIVIWK
jgi:hypothetical protein